MTRDEIYDHLAKVYLDKKELAESSKKTPNKFNAWFVINIVITAFILLSVSYGLTAFLKHRGLSLRQKVMYSLTNSPVRIHYNVEDPYPQIKTFSLSIPKMDVSKYEKINLSIRGVENGSPGVVKMTMTNKRNEVSSYYINNVGQKWSNISISLSDFNISDWSSLTDLSFAVEAWNAEQKQGTLLIDEISFSN